MKKTVLILLICVLLAVSASAGAAYDQYKVKRGDAAYAFAWDFCPLDARNAVVIARTDKDVPWHVTWYRDGELYRDLAGYIADPFLEDGVIPRPVTWDGEHLTMIFSERQEAFRTIRDQQDHVVADPENYKSYMADWTEKGLEKISDLPEDWYTAEDLGKVVIRYENDAFRILINGNEKAIPGEVAHLPKYNVLNLECWPTGGDMFLLAYISHDDFIQHVVCVDNGVKKYDTEIDPMESWLLLPDGNGGFFNRPDSSVTEPYDPIKLTHYSADGKAERDMELKGDRVVLRLQGAAADPDGGITLYGSAVAESRQVYTVFTMKLDDTLKAADLYVRNIDPTYSAYTPYMKAAPDGTVWVLIFTMNNAGYGRPVMIPFTELEKSEDAHGLMLE